MVQSGLVELVKLGARRSSGRAPNQVRQGGNFVLDRSSEVHERSAVGAEPGELAGQPNVDPLVDLPLVRVSLHQLHFCSHAGASR
jgi:hypothetical protein